MIVKNDVHSSVMDFKSLVVGKDTVYRNYNEREWLDDDFKEHIGWIIGRQEIYGINEYIELITQENRDLEVELVETNMEVINLISTISSQNEVDQAEMLMEIMNLISNL